MTKPRKELISLEDTPYYHITARCVRRAFLCGHDHQTGNNYEHRRKWIETRLHLLSSLFTIDIAAYAIMSNHYHIVVKLDPNQAKNWSKREIADRWSAVCKGSLLFQKYCQQMPLTTIEKESVNQELSIVRERLCNLSWFMKLLNEPLARQANKEDNCKGHFFEARYTSQALLTEEALLTCIAYVDLNPVRAKMAQTPETSDHTSIKARIKPRLNLSEAIQQAIEKKELNHFNQALKPLLHFSGNNKQKEQTGIPFNFDDYLTLVDWTGQVIREDKAGNIPQNLLPMLERIHLHPIQWIANSCQFEHYYQKRYKQQTPTLQKLV